MTGFPLKTEQLSIGLIWLFHVSGILGILYGNAEWFIASTPLNLSLSFALLYLNGRTAKNFHWMLFAGFMVGMITEIIIRTFSGANCHTFPLVPSEFICRTKERSI